MLEVHKELTVRGSEAGLDEFVERLTECLDAGWQRNLQVEEEVNREPSLTGEKGTWYGFRYNNSNNGPAVSVWLRRTPGFIRVTNIVPIDKQQLTRREYNTILENFTKRFVERAAKQAGVRSELSSGLLDVRTLMDAATYRALGQFSRNANKGTGLGHPFDEERWNAFVIAAHKASCELRGHILERWLIEEEGWPPVVAQQLADQYEHDRTLLRDFASAAA